MSNLLPAAEFPNFFKLCINFLALQQKFSTLSISSSVNSPNYISDSLSEKNNAVN